VECHIGNDNANEILCSFLSLNPLMPNDPSVGHTAPLTSGRCILYIYSTNTVEYQYNEILGTSEISLL